MNQQKDWIALHDLLTRSLAEMLIGSSVRVDSRKVAAELAAYLADEVYVAFDLKQNRPDLAQD